MESRIENQFSIMDMMPLAVRKFLMGKTDIIQILDDYGIINEQMTGIVKTVKCYRFELGSGLERISSMYFKVLERLIECTMRILEESATRHQKEVKEGLDKVVHMEEKLKEMDMK
jgi:hypothetical protein